MPRCKYCGQPFDDRDTWHRAAKLDRFCSHGCRYSEELPLSHAVNTIVTMDALPPVLAAETAHPADSMEPVADLCEAAEDEAMCEARRRLAAALRLIAMMKAPDRELVLFRMVNPQRAMATYAKRVGVSIQAVSARLKKIYRRHPVLAVIEDRHVGVPAGFGWKGKGAT